MNQTYTVFNKRGEAREFEFDCMECEGDGWERPFHVEKVSLHRVRVSYRIRIGAGGYTVSDTVGKKHECLLLSDTCSGVRALTDQHITTQPD
jgi:hypothetical protein